MAVGMIAYDRYCVDILIRVQAGRASLARVEAAVKSGHRNEQAAKLGELKHLLPRMTRG